MTDRLKELREQVRDVSAEVRREVMENWHQQILQEAPGALEQSAQMEIVSADSLQIGVEIVISPVSSLVGQLKVLQLDVMNIAPEDRRQLLEAWHIANGAQLSVELNNFALNGNPLATSEGGGATGISAAFGEPIASQIDVDEASGLEVSPQMRRASMEQFIKENWDSISVALGISSYAFQLLIESDNTPNTHAQ